METITKRYTTTRKRVRDYINSLEDSFNNRNEFKEEVKRVLSELLEETDRHQIKWYKLVLKMLDERTNMDIPRSQINLLAWLKNNDEWYFPVSTRLLDIDDWRNYEVLHYFNDNNFLVYCWNGKKNMNDGRLFKAKVK